ncbi:hypothetical protein HP437_11625 [Serratia marcescens]|uniref:hypothetical protein n=1 Tax=Serratia marcescens TaxID=615 RepID=UPI0015D6EFE3|nr:hypothetical protein [Serratia marcescens]QLJ65790.1 hypothetical protein HP437_11625 [Serratia marcescens]
MDNKLSELSKPVGFAREEDIKLMQSGKLISGLTIWRSGKEALYSQECVSAMLAELEAKDKRIIGLERHVKDIEATLIVATDEVADLTKERDEARAKLATPVRLPALLQPERDAVNEMIFANGRNEAIAECSVAIRHAGFLSEASPMTIEGDE